MRQVKCIETGVIYKSLLAATKALGKTGIDKAANGVTYTAGGFHWEWCGTDEVEMIVPSNIDTPKRKLKRAGAMIAEAYKEKTIDYWGWNFGGESRL